MILGVLERIVRSLGAIAGLATLAAAVIAMLRSLRRPPGREEPGARWALRASVLLAATFLFLAIGVLLWRPVPAETPAWLRAVLLPVGGLLFFGGLALYLVGLRYLGKSFGPATSFGIRLHAAHRLVTTGPYARVRHPMYLGVIATAIGTFLLFRTWAALCFAITMFGLTIRARREERVLAEEFGAEWAIYVSRVPAWLPRLRIRRDGGT